MFCLVPARKEASLPTDHLEEEVCSEGRKHWKQGQAGTSSERGIGRDHFGYSIASALSTQASSRKEVEAKGGYCVGNLPCLGSRCGSNPLAGVLRDEAMRGLW